MVGCFESGNEHWGSIKFGEFLHQLRKYYLLKKDSASWSLSRQCALYLQVVGLADAAVNKMRYHVSFYGTGET